jgi:hypothetical protein
VKSCGWHFDRSDSGNFIHFPIFGHSKNTLVMQTWNEKIALETNEYAPYYETYLRNVAGMSIAEAMQADRAALLQIFEMINPANENYFYAPGKWTVKEVLLHCIDAERIFAYRALRFMRGDDTDLPGYDHDAYVIESQVKERTIESIKEEWRAVRNATEILFRHAGDTTLRRTGTANKFRVSARAFGLVIPGHYLHHAQILLEKYHLGN